MEDLSELFSLTKAHGKAIEEFKAAQTARLDSIERRMNRPGFGLAGDHQVTDETLAEERKALAAFVRGGKTGDDAEFKAMMVGSEPDGGYLVTPALSSRINAKLFDISPLGRLARRERITTGDAFEEPQDTDDIGATWAGETTTRPASTTAQLKGLRVPVDEIYTNQPVTQRLLDDAGFDVGKWLENKIADKFARSEAAAFVNGTGTAQPRGMLTHSVATTGDSTRAWGVIQYVPTGNASGFLAPTTTASPADALIDLSMSLRAPYRSAARWLMNRTTAGAVRKFKDPDGRFLWSDPAAGQPAMLLGFPVDLDEEFPNVGSNTFPIAFGDFQQAYIVVEKPGLRLLRDPYSSKPNVLFYAYRRVGGGLLNSEAVKLLKVAGS
jgi:HK97 family phage major capsid protein